MILIINLILLKETHKIMVNFLEEVKIINSVVLEQIIIGIITIGLIIITINNNKLLDSLITIEIIHQTQDFLIIIKIIMIIKIPFFKAKIKTIITNFQTTINKIILTTIIIINKTIRIDLSLIIINLIILFLIRIITSKIKLVDFLEINKIPIAFGIVQHLGLIHFLTTKIITQVILFLTQIQITFSGRIIIQIKTMDSSIVNYLYKDNNKTSFQTCQ